MSRSRGIANKLAKIAIAKAGFDNIDVLKLYGKVNSELESIIYSFGIEFASGGNVYANRILDDVAVLQTKVAAIEVDLAGISSSLDDINTIQAELVVSANKVDALASALGILFNIDGTLLTENYTNHTHTYTDVATTDTADGTGITTTTTKSTTGVN